MSELDLRMMNKTFSRSVILSSVFLFLNFGAIRAQVDTTLWNSTVTRMQELIDSGDYKMALLYSDSSLEISIEEFGLNSPQNIEIISKMGEVYFHLGQMKIAYDYFFEALEKAGEFLGADHPQYGTHLANLGNICIPNGQYIEADSLLNQALQFMEAQDSLNNEYGVVLGNLSYLHYILGDFNKAIYYTKLGLKNIEVTLGKQNKNYATLSANLGYAYWKIAKYEEALVYFEEALEINEKTVGKGHLDYGKCLRNQGLVYYSMGQYNEALTCYKEGLEILLQSVGEEHIEYGTFVNNIALVYQAIGDYQKALPLYKKAIVNYEKHLGALSQDVMVVKNNLAILYQSTEEFEKAFELMNESLNFVKNTFGENHPDYCIRLNNIAQHHILNKQFELGEQFMKQALENAKVSIGTEHPDYALILNGYGYALVCNNKNDLGEQYYKESITLSNEVLDTRHPLRSKYLNNLILHYKNTGNIELADSLILIANISLQSQVNEVFSFTSEDGKSKFLKNLNQVNDYYHSIAFDGKYKNDAISNSLFDDELLLKGLILNSITNISKSILEKHDTLTANQFVEWKDLRQYLSRQYSQPVADRIQGIDSLERLANQLEEDLVVKSSEFAKVRKEVKWNNVRDALQQNEAAIEFVNFQYYNKGKTDTNFYAVMLLMPNANKVEYILLFEEKELLQIQRQTQNQNQIENQITNLYSYQSGLYNLIWSKLESHLKDTETIYFSPSGLLHKINFNAIQDEEGGYLMNKYKLVQLNSTREIVNKSKEQFQPKNASIALYGNIDYNLNSEDQLLAEEHKQNDSVDLFATHRGPQILEDLSRKTSWRRIAGSKKEVKKVRKLWPNRKAKLLEGQLASEQTFKQMEGENAPNIYHLATHGFFFEDAKDTLPTTFGERTYRASDNPLLRSGLIMAGANYVWQGNAPLPNKEDGILTALEISNLNLLNTELVVLSACESGLGDIKGSEGVFGLQRAFKMAGVDNLIMSLWKVPDAETEMLMTQFYKNWKRGYDLRSAFKIAQQKMSEKYSPYYWAGFVLIGEVEEERVPDKHLPKWVWIFGGLIGLGVLGVGIKKVA